jgi:hypothetical protein
MATVNQIQARIEETTGRADKATIIQERILDSILEIQREGNHYFMEEITTRSLVVDRQDYLLPTDYHDIASVWLIDANSLWSQTPLEPLIFEEARRKYASDDEGSPEAYTIWRQAIFVWPPKPQLITEKLHLDYYKYLTVMDFDGSDSNEITAQWGDLVEAWATFMFYAKLPGSEEQAAFWKAIADPLYARLVKTSHSYHMQNKVVMKVFDSPKLKSKTTARAFGGR